MNEDATAAQPPGDLEFPTFRLMKIGERFRSEGRIWRKCHVTIAEDVRTGEEKVFSPTAHFERIQRKARS